MPGVFISHSSKDDKIVEQLRLVLQHSMQVWADSRELVGGDQLDPEIRTAIDDSDFVIAVLSYATIDSDWVAEEIRYAEEKKKRIIPLRLDGLKPNAAKRWFKTEPVSIPLDRAVGGVQAILPQLRAALGMELPDDDKPAPALKPQPTPELVLELTDPAMDGERAKAKAVLRYCPADGTPDVVSKRFVFTAPLGPIEAGELSWYLERYVNWPSGPFRDRAEQVEESLPKWGKLLYDALPPHHWKAGSFSVLVDPDPIQGSTAQSAEASTLLLSLPWELLHDGKRYLFQGADGMRVRRRLPNREKQEPLVTDPPIRVLLVSPRPEDDSAAYIDHRVSARPVVEALSGLGDLAEFKLLTPPTFPALQEELRRQHYHVVHFDGHGVWDRKHGLGALCFEDPADLAKLERRRSKQVDANEFAAEITGHRVPLFFLDACQTAMSDTRPEASVAGKLLQSGVASVAAMSHSVLVETARRFVGVFYRELMTGKRVGEAMLAGQLELKNHSWRAKTFIGDLHLQDWFVPVLFQEENDPHLIHAVPSERVQQEIARRDRLKVGAVPPEPDHTFVGRSRELLKAERLLERERYVVLRGEGGEGKTTLAAELARWLVETRRFERGAFVSMEKLGTMLALGEQVVPNYINRAPGDDKEGLKLIERELRGHPNVIVFDNMESVLPPGPGSQAEAAYEPEVLRNVLDLCRKLLDCGQTRLIFTSREGMPEPFGRNEVRIGRLERQEAIALVGKVLGEHNLMPHAKDAGESDEEIAKLVDAVNCHARSLVLLAGEVARGGVRHATENLSGLMAALHKRYPDDRERSLLASVELSLRRLPKETREKIKPLAVFQGGGSLFAIATVLGLDKTGILELAQQLVGVGLGEIAQGMYLRLDPALGAALQSSMMQEDLAPARERWAEAMVQEAAALRQLQNTKPNVAYSLTALEIPNFLACVGQVPDLSIDFATDLEDLISPLGRPNALAHVVAAREAAAQKLGDWNHARYLAESATIDRLIESGHHQQAVRAARALLERAEAAGERAYEEAAYDLAITHVRIGRSLRMSGSSSEALPHLEIARQRFTALNQTSMANVALTDSANCLIDLGQYEEADNRYRKAIEAAEKRNDPREVAVNKTQLGTTLMLQRKYREALDAYHDARKIFEDLGEPPSVAGAWHQIGIVYKEVSQYSEAEGALQKSLRISAQLGDKPGEAGTLTELGAVSSWQGRHEEAVRFYSLAVEVYMTAGDLLREGRHRFNLAHEFIALKRYDDARRELLRAIECDKPFGHVAEPWKTFEVLYRLELATGNRAAALAARQRAVEAYEAYRAQGGQAKYTFAPLPADVDSDS